MNLEIVKVIENFIRQVKYRQLYNEKSVISTRTQEVIKKMLKRVIDTLKTENVKENETKDKNYTSM